MALEKIVCADRAEWLRVRRRLGLGGSDAAAVIGTSEYATPAQVFFEKRGVVVPDVESDQMAIGRMLEGPIAQRYAEKTKRTVVDAGAFTILRDTDRPFMFATLDRLVPEIDGTLECKSANFMGWQIKHDWDEGPPLSYLVQVQHQMAVTGAARCSIAALVGVAGFFIFDIERDDAFIAELVRVEEEFWNRNVLAGVTPVLDGEDDTRRLVNAAWMPDPAKTIALTDPVIAAWDIERQRAADMEKEAKRIKNLADSHIILAMGDAAIGRLPDGSSYKRTRISKAGHSVEPTEYTELRRLKAKEPKKR